jgi:glycosyltransferase involved in cell wall biosynthesis
MLKSQRSTPTVLSVFDIDPFRIGGTEAYARELSSQLADRGWRSALCFNNDPPEAVRRYISLANVNIEVLREPSARGLQPIRDFGKILRRDQPAIVHLHHVPLMSAYPWIARFNSVQKVFYTDHWSRPSSYIPHRSALWKRIVGRAVSLPITGVVSVSNYGYGCIVTSGLIPSKKIKQIYNAVDLAKEGRTDESACHFRERFSIPGDRNLVVQVSWLIPEKGVGDLLEAARIVIARKPAVHFVFVGDGQYRDQFVKRAEELGIAHHVSWTGTVLNPIAEGVYAAADVVCQVSRWEEIFGWTIAEAMACSKPVVATRVGGIPELVRDGLTGFLVPPGDSDAIAEKIHVLLNDAEMRSRMGQMGRTAAEDHFDLKKNVSEVIRLYGLTT